jgi:hypothetical protein
VGLCWRHSIAEGRLRIEAAPNVGNVDKCGSNFHAVSRHNRTACQKVPYPSSDPHGAHGTLRVHKREEWLINPQGRSSSPGSMNRGSFLRAYEHAQIAVHDRTFGDRPAVSNDISSRELCCQAMPSRVVAVRSMA